MTVQKQHLLFCRVHRVHFCRPA